MSTELFITGAGVSEKLVGWEGQHAIRLNVTLQPNPGEVSPDDKLLIDSTRVFFTAPGGYVINVVEESGAVLGAGAPLPLAAGTPATLMRTERSVAHCVVTTTVRIPRSASIPRPVIRQLPVYCDASTVWPAGFESKPASLAQPGPVNFPLGDALNGFAIGLQGPVDIVDLVVSRPPGFRTERHLLLGGHFLNLWENPGGAEFFADPAAHRPDRWHLRLRDHGTGQVVLDEDLPVRPDWPGFGPKRSVLRLCAEFHYARRVPDDMTFGELELEFRLGSATFTCRTEVALAPVDVLHFPIQLTDAFFHDETLNFGNGPAAPGDRSHTHSGDMMQRYAYDLGKFVNGRERKTNKDETLGDFWSFGQPVLSVADGTVIRVEDTVADRMGASDPEPNRVVVRHEHTDGPRYSVYAHIKQGSATVAVGDRISAGDKIAEVGSNGQSSGPHIHLAYYTFDHWGCVRTLPMAFAFSDGAAGTVAGVPQSGLQLNPAPPARPTGAARGLWDVIVDVAVSVWQGVVGVARALITGP